MVDVGIINTFTISLIVHSFCTSKMINSYPKDILHSLQPSRTKETQLPTFYMEQINNDSITNTSHDEKFLDYIKNFGKFII